MREKVTFDGYFYFSYLEPTEIERFVMTEQPKEFSLLLTKYNMDEKRGKSVMGEPRADGLESSLLRRTERRFEEVTKGFYPHLEDEEGDLKVDSLQFDFQTSKQERNLGDVSILQNVPQPRRTETEHSGSVVSLKKSFLKQAQLTESFSIKARPIAKPPSPAHLQAVLSKHDSLRRIRVAGPKPAELSDDRDDESFHNDNSDKEERLARSKIILATSGNEHSSKSKPSMFNLFNQQPPSSLTLGREPPLRGAPRPGIQPDPELSSLSESEKSIKRPDTKKPSLEEAVPPRLALTPDQTSEGMTFFAASSSANQAFDRADSQIAKNLQLQNTQSLQVISEDKHESKGDESIEKKQQTKNGSADRILAPGHSPVQAGNPLQLLGRVLQVPSESSNEHRSQASAKPHPRIVVNHSVLSRSRPGSRRQSAGSQRSDSKTSLDPAKQSKPFIVREAKTFSRRTSHEKLPGHLDQLQLHFRPDQKPARPFFRKSAASRGLDPERRAPGRPSFFDDNPLDMSGLSMGYQKAKGKRASVVDDSLLLSNTPKHRKAPDGDLLGDLPPPPQKPESRFGLYAAQR